MEHIAPRTDACGVGGTHAPAVLEKVFALQPHAQQQADHQHLHTQE